MGRIKSIAFHTFKESVRDRVFYSLVVFALILIASALLVGYVSVGIEQVVLINLALSGMSIIGLLIAVFVGIGLVAKEIEGRTIHNLLSKPVPRFDFILGRYFGLLLTLGVNTAVMTVGFYLVLGLQKGSLEPADAGVLRAVYLIFLQLSLVVGLALLFSCISTHFLAAVFTVSLFIIGNHLRDIEMFGRQTGSALVGELASALYFILPNFGNFDAIALAAHGVHIPNYVMVYNSFYALLYAAVLVSSAILVFEEREFR